MCVMHGNSAHKTHYHMSHQARGARVVLMREKNHSVISSTWCLKCQRLLVDHTPIECWSETIEIMQEEEHPTTTKALHINSRFILEAKHHYFQAASCDVRPKLPL